MTELEVLGVEDQVFKHIAGYKNNFLEFTDQVEYIIQGVIRHRNVTEIISILWLNSLNGLQFKFKSSRNIYCLQFFLQQETATIPVPTVVKLYKSPLSEINFDSSEFLKWDYLYNLTEILRHIEEE